MSYLKKSHHKSRKLRLVSNHPPKRIKKSVAKRTYPLRLRLVWGILLVAIVLLGVRLYYLQIIQGEELATKAKQQQLTSLTPYTPRRQIVDRNNNVLATDELHYTLYIHPKYFSETPEEVAEKIATILPEQTPSELVEKFQTRPTGIKLVDNLPEHVAEDLKALRLNGIDLNQEYRRFYPQGNTIAEVVGYVDRAHQGQAGIENSQQRIISSNIAPDRLTVRRTGEGYIIPAEIPANFLTVDDLRLQLTIDLGLQKVARTALQKQIRRYNAKRGTVLVMDAQNGALLAMVSEPTYDPNNYSKYPVELFRNWAVTDLYEPGSTFKSINVAIALEMGVIQPDTRIYDAGKLEIDVWEVRNHDYQEKGANGILSITEILEKSSNVGMIEIMKRIPPQDFYRQLENLGLKTNVGVGLPGDTPGHLKPEVEFFSHEIEPATASFGQGLSLTPLKLLQLNGILANNGVMVTPRVVNGLVDSQGNLHWQPNYNEKRIFSPTTTQAVLKMMESVVEEGSGFAAQVPGYRIAGKTGTSQKAVRGGYDLSAKITSFVGIIPVSSPRYVVLAVVDEPKGHNTFGSTVAAPIVGEVMQSLIAIEGIPPDGELETP
ncbi:MAG: penicillin-binding protein 2 [Gloeocapsa sp. DLM2.Bin57]|nr:MAG: penicillin-binding protein 2 [Gloeocapsa sp. DLM2.Bin57]